MKGIILKSTGSFYLIEDKKNTVWQGRIRGKLKYKQNISSTNPIAVGDWVSFDVDNTNPDNPLAVIKEIHPRDNYIVRSSPHNKKQIHIISANLDQAAIIATITHPKTSLGFIDRFLVTAEAYHIPAVVIFNKCDLLLSAEDQEELLYRTKMYQDIGYKVFNISAEDPATLAPLITDLHGKTTLLSGHSGVGKSTLLNALIPNVSRMINEVSESSGKGQHTTTFAEMFALPENAGRVIDTPGVKEFGLVNIEKSELSHYFPEMAKRINECKFNNCLHINEPSCAVLAAMEDGLISPDRYNSYVNMLDSIESNNY